MKKTIIFFPMLFICLQIFSQTKYEIKGKVVDSANGNWLPGVSISPSGFEQVGAFSDENGDYSISLPSSHQQYTLIVKLLGYEEKTVNIRLESNARLDIELKPSAITLGEVVVSGVRRDENITTVQAGVDKLEIETINKIPVLLGERDILKTIQLLPGIKSAGEGNSGYYVRGGSSDQNLITLDKATVYNPSHLLGFFSTFNSDIVEDVTIFKGTIPAQYGGRLSSVLDVNMRDGDMNKYSVGGGIGLISSKVYAEGPIQKGKSSFLVAARRTYADVLARAIGVEEVKNSSLYFYDLNAKLSYVLSPKDKITIMAYNGKDKLGLNNIATIDWSNTVAALGWNRIANEKFTFHTSLSYTNYTYNAGIALTTGLDIASHIRDYNLGQEFNLYPNDKNKVKFGYASTYRQVVPGELVSRDPKQLQVDPYQHRYSWENSVFASHNIQLTDKLATEYGIRISSFSVLGGGYFYNYNSSQQIIDSISTRRSDFVKTYWNVEPRISAVFQLDQKSSLKAGYSRSVQNIHLLSTANMASPTDRWVVNTNYIKPEISDQISAGYFRNFDNNNFEFSAEIYYKKLKNQIDYKDGAEITTNDNVETELLFGKGRAYGIELFLKKRYGRFNGWIGYTLSRSEKKIDKINDDKWYPSNQDRTHDISIVGIYELNKKWTLSGTWIYATGTPMTFPNGKYTVEGHAIYLYEGRNKYRSRGYHRLDLGATYTMKKTKKHLSELTFSLYNAYGRHNTFMYQIEQNYSGEQIPKVKMIYLFTFIPSISWNFKF